MFVELTQIQFKSQQLPLAHEIPSEQHCQPSKGQQPKGHSVPSHCLLAAIWVRRAFWAINGQSAAVAAQYMPSGQQYHPTQGQHPPGHSVPSHCSDFVSFTWLALATAKKAKTANDWYFIVLTTPSNYLLYNKARIHLHLKSFPKIRD